MSAIPEGGPAFPSGARFSPNGSPISEGWDGMTLRDYFAGQSLIMSGVYAIAAVRAGDTVNATQPAISANAYRMADAMLKAREATT